MVNTSSLLWRVKGDNCLIPIVFWSEKSMVLSWGNDGVDDR